jgi:periplasmic divalent cation tolerance protein
MFCSSTSSIQSEPEPVLLVLCTCPDDIAETLAAQVVEARLAACVHQIPGISSTYRWEDKMERSTESLLMLKTTVHLYNKLENFIISKHPYECPEIIQLAVQDGYGPYLTWIRES